MISVRTNPNIQKWFQVFSFGQFIDEFQRESKAIRVAELLAKQNNHEVITVDGQARKVRSRQT